MKNLLLSSAALCGLAMVATPAVAQVELELGGYFKGYGAFVDQDETAGEVNDFGFVRDTELHIGGESTLDNGLTVGAHFELDVDGADGDSTIDESYMYLSGGWGRVNFGDEDGAAYLLQVAAPSADSNIDGIRQYINPVNTEVLTGTDLGALDYDQDVTGKSTKLTYLSPIVNGFQGGVSYTPDSDGYADDLEGIGTDNAGSVIGATYEIAGRYEGQFNNVGLILGAGYSFGELETDAVTSADDAEAWNIGADLDFGPFGLGAIYLNDNTDANGVGTDGAEEETYVVGVDYTTGPFKLGASYLDQSDTNGTDGDDATRYSGGVVYTYGPGMTFRGSLGYVEYDQASATDDDATYVTLGTQVKF